MQNFGTAQLDYRINTRDSHRSGKRKKGSNNPKPPNQKKDSATKKQLKFFGKTVEGVSMDILDYTSDMALFMFRILDTIGYLQRCDSI